MANFFSKFTKQVKDTVENTVKPAVQQTQQNNARPQAGAPKTFTADEVFQEAKAQLQAGNVQQGMNNLIMLAGDGYVSAMTELADIYYLNTYGQGQNIPEFFKYTKMAAEAGAPLAAHNMGFAYKDGVGVPQNFQESVKWYKIAACLLYTSPSPRDRG